MRVLSQTESKINYQCRKCGNEVEQKVQDLLDEIAEREENKEGE